MQLRMMSDSCIGEEISCMKNMMCGLQASGIYFAKIYYHHKLWIICVFDHIQIRLKASVFVHANFSSHSLLVTGAFFFSTFSLFSPLHFIFATSFHATRPQLCRSHSAICL